MLKSQTSQTHPLKLIRSLTLILTTLSYQSLILLTQTPAIAQFAPRLCATPGKDGPSSLGGIINTYYAGATNTTVAAGSTSIPVGAINPNGSTTPIAAGDLLLIIQMQGADIDASNTDSYGNGVSGGGNNSNVSLTPVTTGASGNLNNANFTAGNYEYVVATGPIAGGSIPIQGTNGGGLINSYSNTPFGTQGQRTYQVIRVPQYSSATMSSSLTAAPWNGATGGILIYDVAGNLNLASATVDVSGIGFRGGAGRQLTGTTGLLRTDYVTSSTSDANGSKGEGTAGTPRYVLNSATISATDNGVEGYPGGSYGRGAPGNAGGGSTDGQPINNRHNSGGGGGSNGGTGGLGGRSWTSGVYVGGFGGASFPANSNRVVLGGGGGAGTTNQATSATTGVPTNGIASSGANGGGIVLIRTASVSGSGTINANGATAFDVRQDGTGGGGAGGSVMVTSANNNLAGLTVNARGGNGGNVKYSNAAEPFGGAHGPGGGGGGGVVFTSAGANVNVTGGQSGTAKDPIDPVDPYFGATAGAGGISQAVGAVPGANSGAECVPQLTITKTTSTPGPIIKPGKATYTITVANAANRATATNIDITDPLPSGFSFDGSVAPTVTLNGGATRTSVTNPATGATTLNFSSFNIPGGASVQITFTTDVAATVPDGVYNNGATATYLDPTRTIANGTTSVTYDPATVGEEVAVGSAAPTPILRLRGVKRITNVVRNGLPLSGVNFGSFIDDPNDQNDNAPGWSQLSPVGIINLSSQFTLQSGDEVEYTIYFLADGNQPIQNARFCDPIPTGTTFISNSFASASGILVNLANTNTPRTNAADGDNGSFFSPLAPLSANNVCPNQTNPTGAVVVNFGTLNYTSGNNFGFVRFRVRVD
ncbi:conserved repeat domain protein [Anabaenopsis circularis NIES-21]|uniref:Conserved repeat domain protein n=1 Tax=Anabaenopsis circularis NIES-21 TaxID=1085406 RepID=A0A1Z4GLT4_9CYAN|nr:conserved repeat domain protein [Anabaenopsis circularis NIES-21]